MQFEAALAAASPFAAEPALSDDLDFAIRQTVKLGTGASAWRRKQLRTLKKICNTAVGINAAFPPGQAATRLGRNVPAGTFDLLRYALQWPDTALPALFSTGAQVIGDLGHIGIYRDAAVHASVDLAQFQASNEDWIAQVEAMPRPRGEQSAVIWKKTAEELDLGFMSGLFTKAEMDARFGLGKWRPLVRFAVWQEGSQSWRVIDNGRSAAHNDTVVATERIHTTSTEVGLAMAQRFRKYANAPLAGGLELRSSTSDMWKAFRQIPVCDEHLPYHVVAVYSEKEGVMRYGPLDGMAFGLGAAVLQFNRVPAFLLALARRFLCIPVVGFYDDYRITDIAEGRGSADATFQELLAWLAIRLDPKKHQAPAPLVVFIGSLEDSSCAGVNDEIILRPKPGRA
ncbi:hypothetical protein, partial [Yoonia sp.]|uniref:hypothetical protein n=1 Tax=Yoonia sp. TaxID=2212373 RepID=UPI0025D26069